MTASQSDPEVKSAMEQLYANLPQALLDAATILGLVIPETNSPVRATPDVTNTEQTLIDEIREVAAKYSAEMSFTILYTVQGFSLQRVLIPAALAVVGVTAVFLYVHMRKPKGGLTKT